MTDDRDRMFIMLDEAEKILDLIAQTFGPDDPKTHHATRAFQDLVVDPTEETIRMALMYVRWCLNYPARIGKNSEPFPEETCGDCSRQACEGGFILDDPEQQTWRPCHKLLPELHENWQKETGYLYDNK
jgi:hypothetical protein